MAKSPKPARVRAPAADPLMICFCPMFKRQTTGSVVCASCRSLVGVNDDTCYNCGRRNPGLWGFGPMLRTFGNDLGFVSLVVYGCSALYIISLALTVAFGGNIMGTGNPLTMLSPHPNIQYLLGASGAGPVFAVGRWWTVLSASWLHGGVLHILFNMLWVRQLGPATAEIYGPGRMVIIYTDCGRGGIHAEQPGRVLHGLDADPVPEGRLHDRRRVRLDFRPAGRARLLRTSRRELDHSKRGAGLRDHARDHGIHPAERRQLRARAADSSAAIWRASGWIR